MGNYKSAYITKQPNSVDPSEWIAKQEEIGLYYKQLSDKKKQDKIDSDNKVIEADLSKTWDWTSSGNASFDEFVSGVGNQMLSKWAKSQYDAEQALIKHGVNSQEYHKKRSYYNNLSDTVPKLKMMYATTKQELDDNAALMKTGDYVQPPSNLKAISEFEGGEYQFRIKDDGSPRIKKGIVSLDGKNFTGLNLKQPIKKLYAKDIATALAEDWGEKEIQTRKGYIDYTTINSLEDIVDAQGNKVKGLRSSLLDYYNDTVTDEVAERYYATEKNEFLDFDGKSVSEDSLMKKKSDLIHHLVDTTIPLIKQKKGLKFDTSARNQDVRTANKNKENKSSNPINYANTVTYGKGENTKIDLLALTKPHVEKGANNSALQGNYGEVGYDRETGKIFLRGEKLSNKQKTPEFKAYSKAIKAEAEAELLYNGLYKKDGYNNEKEEQRFIDARDSYFKRKAETKIAEQILKDSPKNWVENTITNETKLFNILGKRMEATSFQDLKSKIIALIPNQEEDQEVVDDLPNLDDLPDLQ